MLFIFLLDKIFEFSLTLFKGSFLDDSTAEKPRNSVSHNITDDSTAHAETADHQCYSKYFLISLPPESIYIIVCTCICNTNSKFWQLSKLTLSSMYQVLVVIKNNISCIDITNMDLDLDSEDIQIEKYPTAYKVYQDLWSEFYNWERLFCQQNLEGLSKSVIHPRSRFHHAGEMYDLPSFSSSEEDFFTYEDISFDSTVSTKFTFSPNPKIIQSQTLEPSAGYTACTAISTNIIQKDDPASLSFAPHADDPLFALDDYLSHAGWFTWQFDFKDPDRK